MSAMGHRVTSPGRIYLTGGATALLHGWHTIPACLVRMARPRLSRAGLMSACLPCDDGAELALDEKLEAEGTRAHTCYNALVRELISFEHALDHRLSKQDQSSI